MRSELTDCAPCAAAQQTSALLWLLSRRALAQTDAATRRAVLSHLNLLAGNAAVDPLLRRTCARLLEQWAGRPAPARDLH